MYAQGESGWRRASAQRRTVGFRVRCGARTAAPIVLSAPAGPHCMHGSVTSVSWRLCAPCGASRTISCSTLSLVCASVPSRAVRRAHAPLRSEISGRAESAMAWRTLAAGLDRQVPRPCAGGPRRRHTVCIRQPANAALLVRDVARLYELQGGADNERVCVRWRASV